MANSHQNREQSILIEQTDNQRNPGAAKAADFEINLNRGPGQCGDSAAEREKLLAEGSADKPISERHEVPHRRFPE